MIFEAVSWGLDSPTSFSFTSFELWVVDACICQELLNWYSSYLWVNIRESHWYLWIGGFWHGRGVPNLGKHRLIWISIISKLISKPNCGRDYMSWPHFVLSWDYTSSSRSVKFGLDWLTTVIRGRQRHHKWPNLTWLIFLFTLETVGTGVPRKILLDKKVWVRNQETNL